ncbi:MAG: phage tail protein [Pseudomonadota bacterium]
MNDKAQSSDWPLPKFHFLVQIEGAGPAIAFQEVSGLDTETDVIEYRAGHSKVFDQIKLPGMIKSGNVTMRKGVFAADNVFWDWFNQIKMNTVKRGTVTISLLDQEGSPTMVWTLSNAWPTKITGTDLKSDGNAVSVEAVEFAYETLTIQRS